MRLSRFFELLFPAYPTTQVRHANARVDAALVREALRLHGRFRLRAIGGSMNPAIPDRELIEVVPVARHEVGIGDTIMAAYVSDYYVIHRVVWCGRRTGSLWTKGDSLDGLDLPIRGEQLLGRVRWHTLRGRTVTLNSKAMRFGGRMLAVFSICSLIPATLARRLFGQLPGGARFARFVARVSRVPGWVAAWAWVRMNSEAAAPQYSGQGIRRSGDR